MENVKYLPGYTTLHAGDDTVHSNNHEDREKLKWHI
jgi:hypothetical protein